MVARDHLQTRQSHTSPPSAGAPSSVLATKELPHLFGRLLEMFYQARSTPRLGNWEPPEVKDTGVLARVIVEPGRFQLVFLGGVFRAGTLEGAAALGPDPSPVVRMYATLCFLAHLRPHLQVGCVHARLNRSAAQPAGWVGGAGRGAMGKGLVGGRQEVLGGELREGERPGA